MYVIVLALLTWLLVKIGLPVAMLRASLPFLAREHVLPGLDSPVTVKFDRYGIPSITATSRLDAVRALGYITAKDRLFQIDLLRRLSAGRLSEILGKRALEKDTEQRVYGFNRVARAILDNLPNDQRQILQAYTDGVNVFIERTKIFPPEFLALHYKPEPWSMEDSILIVLYIFQELTKFAEGEERMTTVMESCLPSDVVTFLTPDTDDYATVLLGGRDSHRPTTGIPVASLAALVRSTKQNKEQGANAASIHETTQGSNAWVVDKTKTRDGRAILACDMHLSLSVPNSCYQACLRYNDTEVSGFLFPGTPMIMAGTNQHIAWGFTATSGDYLDLVQLEINPDNPDEYKTPAGWCHFDTLQETIRVKGKQETRVSVKTTIWGPVSQHLLLGKQVALRWTALDPQATDLGLVYLDEVGTLEEAVKIMQNAGGPQLNAMLADNTGRIAWTLCGKMPIRKGLDGTSSKSWSDGDKGWEGYVSPRDLPYIIDPPSGFLVTANNRTLGQAYPHVMGHNFTNGYRAYQISTSLQKMDVIVERDMFELQLDTTSNFYDFYQTLALEMLTEEVVKGNTLLSATRIAIENWNKKADTDSKGFGLLVRFREKLAKKVINSYLAICEEVDNNFAYSWKNFESPLRRILTERIPEIIPGPANFIDWKALIIGILEESARELIDEYKRIDLEELTWGKINKAAISHPFANILPGLGRLLNMPRDPLPGCRFSIRASEPSHGAAMRMVVSPGREDGLAHMPCGQSGHPLSPNYKDQQNHWITGEPLPFPPRTNKYTLRLNPGSNTTNVVKS